jgi:tape measure domain-containing protein
MRQISPLALRIQVTGSRDAQGQVRQFAGSLDLAAGSAKRASQSVREVSASTAQVGVAARSVAGLSSSLESGARSADHAKKSISEMGRAARERISDFKDLAKEAAHTAQAAMKVFDVYKALQSRKPISIFSAVVPEATQKKIAYGLLGKSIGEGALMAKGLAAAGQVQSVEAGLSTNLRGSGVTVPEMMAQLRAFDADSQLDFLESSKTANYLIATGSDAKSVISEMRTIGDAVGSLGGDQEDFQGIARAIAQIRSRGKGAYSSEEGNQLAERGIGANAMISKATGVSEADIQSGNHSITADVALDAIMKGMAAKFAGGMEKAAATLPGQLATLNGAFFQLQATLGQHLIPIAVSVVGVINNAVQAFNNLPEPIHKIVAWSIALDGAFAGVLGTGILLLIMWGKYKLAMTVVHYGIVALNFVLGLFGTSLGTVAAGIWAQMLPALAAWGFTMLGLVAAVGALIYVSKLYWDELQHGTKTVEDARDAEAVKNDEKSADAVRKAIKDSESLSDKDRYAVLKAAISKAGELGDTDLSAEIEAVRGPLQKKLRKAGVDTGDVLRGGESGAAKALISSIQSQSAGNKAARLSAVDYLPSGSGAAPDTTQVSSQISAATRVAAPASISAPMTVGVADAQLRSQQPDSVQNAQGAVDALVAEIQSLQDQKRNAVDKEARKALAETIVQKQRMLAAARRELAASKTLAGQGEKKANLAEKDARMLAKIDSDAAYEDRILSLEEELEKAKDDADAKKVHALTLQIARLKAQAQFDEDIIAARDEEDPGHKKALEEVAKKKRDIANRRGLTAANKAAGNVTSNEAKKQGLTPAEINAIFRATGATMLNSSMGFSALNPSGSAGAGDRFAGLPPSLYGNSVSDGLSQGIGSLGDFNGSESRRAMNRERTARVKSVTKRSRNVTTIQFEALEIEDAGGFENAEVD